MTDKVLYKSALDFLLSFDVIKQTDLNKHLVSEYEKPKDLKIIYRRICESAQNKQMSSKVIGNSIGGVDNLRIVLFDFDPHMVAENFKKKEFEKQVAEEDALNKRIANNLSKIKTEVEA